MSGWIEVDDNSFWAHYGTDESTYATIARISSNKYHVRYYTNHKDFDIGTCSTITKAKQLAKSKLRRNLHNVL